MRFLSVTALRNAGFLLAASILALLVRLPLLSHETTDYRNFLHPWYGFLVANDFFRALAFDFYDYSPSYLYLMAAAAYVFPSGPDLIVIKGLSIVFDFLLAFFVAKCVRRRYPDSEAPWRLAFLAGLLAPGVVANSAFWAQADAVYTAFLVGSLYFLSAGRSAPAFLLFGLSFSLKLQAVFLLPLLWWLSAKMRIEWRFLPLAPLAYLATLLPAWWIGRPFYELVMLRVARLDHFRSLSERAPHLYIWVSNEWYAFWPLFVLLFGGVVWGIAVLARKSRAALTPELFWTLALLSALLAPYLLPKMHERYFFPAAVVAIVFAFVRPRFWAVPVVLGFASFGVYTAQFLFDWRPNVTARWGAAILFVVVAILLRRLWRDLGVRFRWREVPSRTAARARALVPAAVPLLALLGCLGAALLFAGSGKRFERPVAAEPASARTLARAANLSAEHRFVPVVRQTLDPGGAVAYETDGGRPPGADLLLRLVTFHFGEGSAAEAVAARGATAALFCLAALFAYLSLARLFGNRGIALGVTLLGFSPFAGGAWDSVTVSGAPALFAVFLAFHGMTGFVRDGRFRPLLLQCGAALLFAAAAYPLVLAFAGLGLLLEARRRRNPNGASAERLPAGTTSPPEATSLPDPPPEAATPLPAGPVAGRLGFRSPFATLAVFGLALGGALAGLDRGNERALRATGAPVSEAPPAEFGEPGAADARRWSRFGRALVPFAFAPEVPGERGGGFGLATGLAGGLATILALLGAALSRHRLLLLPLVLSGLFLLTPIAPPEAAGAAAVPVALTLLSLIGLALSRTPAGDSRNRLRRSAAATAFAGAAAAVFLVSAHRAGAAGDDLAAAALEARVGADFDRIRRVLERRVEEPTVFVPAGPWGPPERASRYLPGSILVDLPARRRLAEFALEGRRGLSDGEGDEEIGAEAGAGLLTPENEEVFLYHRAARDGELDRMIAAAGPPVLRGEFDLYLDDEGLLYVREDCRPEDREGLFVLHLDPEDPADLRPGRRQFGFENLSFRFFRRALDLGPRCVARALLPDYPVRRMVIARHPGERYADWIWYHEFFPNGDGGAGNGPE